jgi:hypothetical protein
MDQIEEKKVEAAAKENVQKFEKENSTAGPTFYGYKPPKWAKDHEYVRQEKGKGSDSDSQTWQLYLIDRLLRKHSN